MTDSRVRGGTASPGNNVQPPAEPAASPDVGAQQTVTMTVADLRKMMDDTIKQALEARDFRSPREDERDEDSRYGEERAAKERELVDATRRAHIREVMSEALLPSLPKKPGFHRCWVSTTHQVDTPQRRRRLGYDFVNEDEVRAAGWECDHYAVKDGSFKGYIAWREMIAMEIPEDDYQAIMRENHHFAPKDMERGIFETVDQMRREMRGAGGDVVVSEGFEEMARRDRVPTFVT